MIWVAVGIAFIIAGSLPPGAARIAGAFIAGVAAAHLAFRHFRRKPGVFL